MPRSFGRPGPRSTSARPGSAAGASPSGLPATDDRSGPGAMAANLRWLYAGRIIRSFATAFLTVVFPLYLAQQHDSSTTVGLVLTLGSVLGAALVAAVGVFGDRVGRRPVLVAVGLLGTVGAAALAVSPNLAVVVVASGLGGIGRGGGAGSGGAFGPFFPAEQPLLAASVPPVERTRAFGRLGFLGVLAAAAGSLVAGVPDLLHHAGLSWLASYRLVFLIGAAASLAVAAVSIPLREPPRRPMPATGTAPPADPEATPAGLSTRQLVGRLGLTNALNGFGFGFLGPLLTYWFHVRFGAGPAEVGTLYTIVNLASAAPYLGAHRLTDRLGAVRTVAVTRAASVAMLAAMALAPDFAVAGLLLALRTVANSLGLPARQSYTMGAADERRRGTVAALGTLPSMVTSSVSPVVGGALMGSFVDIPIVGAAVFMAANAATYYLSFRRAPLPHERPADPRGDATVTPAAPVATPDPLRGAPPDPSTGGHADADAGAAADAEAGARPDPSTGAAADAEAGAVPLGGGPPEVRP